jgi:3-oxoacyl-[acyl-carrier-protein] synthase II
MVEVNPSRRIIITGMGMVSNLGLNVETTWRRLIKGESGIVPIDIPFTQVKVGGIIKDFNPETALDGFNLEAALKGFIRKKDFRRLSRSVQFSTASAIEALKNAGLNEEGIDIDDKLIKDDYLNHLKKGIDPTRVGVTVGTGVGGAHHIADITETVKAGKRVGPMALLNMLPERTASVVSMAIGAKGAPEMVSAACASGNKAITLAAEHIKRGHVDIMLAGGTESVMVPGVLEAFLAAGALANELDPKEAYRASRPFDKSRKGFVMSEGAGMIVLEEREHAVKRGVKILAELVGFGDTADAFHDTAPSGEGAERAMELAIKEMGGLPKEGLIYIHAHGTATQKDDVEMGATRNVMKNNGRDEKSFAVSSTKGAMGHGVGAAGAFGAIFSIKALNEGILPPTINLSDPMDEASGIDLVPNQAKNVQPVAAINNSFGFGGFNVVTIFEKPKD